MTHTHSRLCQGCEADNEVTAEDLCELGWTCDYCGRYHEPDPTALEVDPDAERESP